MKKVNNNKNMQSKCFQKCISVKLQQQEKGHLKDKLNQTTLRYCNHELSLEQQFDCNSVKAPNVNLFYNKETSQSLATFYNSHSASLKRIEALLIHKELDCLNYL